jgi:hypothetical protein
MAPTSEQQAAFDRDGFLLVSGLIPEAIAANAESALWRSLGADPKDPSTWKDKAVGTSHRDAKITAIFTQEMAEFVALLSNEAQPDWQPPQTAYAINVFPESGEWRHHGPHIDHSLERDQFLVFPRPMRLASLLYLTDCNPNGGPTVVWPGSHKIIEAQATNNRERFVRMFTLGAAIGEVELGDGIQISGKRGDVLFYHYLCAHSGSKNVLDYPRFAIAHKW